VMSAEDPRFQGCIFVARNITERKRAERRIRYLARYDTLTKIPNRLQFQHSLQQAIARTRRAGRELALIYLDLDRFKEVNDTLGHATGDALLKCVAERLQSCVRAEDTVARLGGDEFAIIQERCQDQRACSTELAARIAKLLTEPFLLPGHRVEIGTSIGIAVAPDHGRDQEQLLKKADLALYRSKAAGRNRATPFRG